MTPKERAIAALMLKVPDKVPTFELDFQLEEEMFGRKFLTEDMRPQNLASLSAREREAKLYDYAEYVVKVYTELEYSIIPGPYTLNTWLDEKKAIINPDLKLVHKFIRQMVGDTVMIGYHGDGTFAIPDGDAMYEFAYAIADDPDSVKPGC